MGVRLSGRGITVIFSAPMHPRLRDKHPHSLEWRSLSYLFKRYTFYKGKHLLIGFNLGWRLARIYVKCDLLTSCRNQGYSIRNIHYHSPVYFA